MSLLEHVTQPRTEDTTSIAAARVRLREAVSALSEGPMPRPVKGPFVIKGDATNVKVPIEVLKADIYDNVFAIEKARGGWFVHHIPTGLLAGTFKKQDEAKKAIQAAYDLAPSDDWNVTSVPAFPAGLLNKWHSAIAPMMLRRKFGQTGVEPDVSNRREQRGAVKKDLNGWIKEAWKAVAKGAKFWVEYKLKEAYYASAGPRARYQTTVDQPVWPATFEGEGKEEISDYKARYGQFGLSRSPLDPDIMDLRNWKPTKKNATVTAKASSVGRGMSQKYKITITLVEIEPLVMSGEVVVHYTWTASKV
jgi:hypothetical protein